MGTGSRQLLCALMVVLGAGGVCRGQLFSGASSFTFGPTSQLGPVTNNLTLTDNANGFVVSGQVLVSVPPNPVSGTLVSWVVDRPLNPAYGTNNLFTTTVLDGFSQPPPGSVGNTSGVAESFFTNYPVASLSQIPVTLTAGAATWNNIIVNSSTFSYTSGGVNYLRQRFDVDGIYNGGPGGTWTIDVPVTTTASVVPEPAGVVLMSLAGLALYSLPARRRGRPVRRPPSSAGPVPPGT